MSDSNWTLLSVPANARTRASFRSSTCICCGETIDKQRGDVIKQVTARNNKTGVEKIKWVHERCANALGSSGPKPSAPPATESKPSPSPAPATATVEASSTDMQQAMQLLSSLFGPKVDEGMIQTHARQAVATAIVPICEEVDGLRKVVESIQPKVVKIQVGEKPEVTLPDGDIVHEIFEKALQLAQARKNIMLVGPTGSGKTHLAGQLAEALGLPFKFISCSGGMSEGQLLGRLLPVGQEGKFEYVQSEFVNCYENGGVFAFDEFDAADPNVLLVVNAALANGQLAIPNRPDKPIAKKHKDFICVTCANTFGTGSDRKYVGRARLDEATVERFRIGTLFMDYDADLEKMLCPNKDLRKRLASYRKAIVDQRLERVVSTRFMKEASEMSSMDWSDDDIDAALFSGWKDTEVSMVKEYAKTNPAKV